jgi:tetratricopeptide (TPR) repeat protein
MNNFSLARKDPRKFLAPLALCSALNLGLISALVPALNAPLASAAGNQRAAMSPSEQASISQLTTLRKAANFKQIAVLLRTIKPQNHSLQYCIALPDAVSSKAHNVKAIIDFLNAAIAVYPKSDQLYLSRAETWLKVDESELAEPDIRQAIELNPRSAKAHSDLCEFLRNQQKYKESLKEVQEAIDCGGPKDKLYNQKAEIFIQLFELKQAEQAFREAIKNSDGTRAWLPRQHMAKMFCSSKRFGEALAEFKLLAGPNPKPEYKIDIATCLVGLEKYKEALTALNGEFPEEYSLSGHRLKKQCFIGLKDSARAKQEDQIIAKLSADF